MQRNQRKLGTTFNRLLYPEGFPPPKTSKLGPSEAWWVHTSPTQPLLGPKALPGSGWSCHRKEEKRI